MPTSTAPFAICARGGKSFELGHAQQRSPKCGKRGMKRQRSLKSARKTTHASRRKLKIQKVAPVELDAIVISLERRPDRMLRCAAALDKYCPGINYKMFPATDGKVTPIPESQVVHAWNTALNVKYQILRSQRKGWNDLESYQVRDLVLSPGERGCSSSHIRAWEHCLEAAGDSDRPLLVLEDDADPTQDFCEILAHAMRDVPHDAHVLYLGYSQAADWRREITSELVESEYVWTTVGYIVWPAGARIMLSQLPIDQPVDNWMATLCANDAIKAYCVRPKIIRQADAWNVNSDVSHSDEMYWGSPRNSDILHSDALYWGGPESDDPRAKADQLMASARNNIFSGLDAESDSEVSDSA